jgi:quinol-cytochrome oxidoreductase complex cytochrome b subunit
MTERDPALVDPQTRVLGVVPGKPAAGERKVLQDDDAVMVWPHLLVRHAVAALQELLAHFHPLVAGVLVPGAIVLGLAALPYIDRNPSLNPRFRRVARVTFTIFMVVWIVLTLVGFAFRGPNWGWVWPWEEWHGEL